MELSDAPRAQLSNGVTVANFSSPHPFTFDDGTVLAACDSDRVEAGALETIESPSIGIKHTTDIRLKFDMSESAHDMYVTLQTDPAIDIIIVPLPMMTCLRQRYGGDLTPDEIRGLGLKARVVRMADRVNKIIHHDKFCI